MASFIEIKKFKSEFARNYLLMSDILPRKVSAKCDLCMCTWELVELSGNNNLHCPGQTPFRIWTTYQSEMIISYMDEGSDREGGLV